MSWVVVSLPITIENFQTAVDENLTCYSFSSVQLGGNFRLVKCDLTTGTCTSHNTGIPVPSTDGHYNIRQPFIEGDYIYGCWARWSDLNCYKFDKNTGAGSSYGRVASGGHTDINYHYTVKLKEDVQYFWARVGTGTEWKLWRFKGSSSQIIDPTLWEEVGYIFRDPDSPATCPEGSINYSYCAGLAVYERYVMFECYQRCPPGNIGNFAIFIFDTVKEKLYNTNFEEVPFGLSTTDPRVKITVENPPDTSGRIGAGHIVVDMANKRAYVAQEWLNSAGIRVGVGITKVDMTTRRARYVNIPGGAQETVSLPGLTTDGKVLFIVKDVDGVVRIKALDPATDTITNILDLPSGALSYAVSGAMLATEDCYIPIQTIINTLTHLILAPNWQDGLKIPKRISVTSPSAGQLRVQAQFHLAPSSIRVRVWKIPEYTIQSEEDLVGTTNIDRLYSLPSGKYRVEVIGYV